MVSIFEDLLRFFVKVRYVAASFPLLLALSACSPDEEKLTSNFVLSRSPSGLNSISMFKDSALVPKVPPSVISILGDKNSFYITRQYVDVAIHNDVPALTRRGSYQYFILDKHTEILKEVSGDEMLGRIVSTQSDIVSIDM